MDNNVKVRGEGGEGAGDCLEEISAGALGRQERWKIRYVVRADGAGDCLQEGSAGVLGRQEGGCQGTW